LVADAPGFTGTDVQLRLASAFELDARHCTDTSLEPLLLRHFPSLPDAGRMLSCEWEAVIRFTGVPDPDLYR
jgi:hypothetical protein